MKSKSLTWMDLCHCILHEYGHILDYRKKKNTKRWILASEFDGYTELTVHTAPAMPKKAKIAILQTEYIADQFAKKLAKKYNVSFPEHYLDIEQILNIKVRKYEMIHGCPCSKNMRVIWENALATKFLPLTKNYIKDFTYL
jgi:hypothetical protein